MKIRRRYKNNSKINILLPLIFLFVVFLSVGYSSLNQELNITSEASFRLEEDIRITDVKLVGSAFNGIENYNSSYSKDRIKTGITLSKESSSITYQVTITNAGNVPMLLNLLDNISYNNDGITYELNKKLPYFINKGEEKSIEITYKWNSYNEKNKNLDAVIKFNFIKVESVLAKGTDNATFINNSSFDRSKIESIKFMPTIDVPSSAIEVWDASLNKDGSVMAYTLDNDSNDLYELYIAGYGEIKLSKASYLFENFTNMVTIDFDNLVTTKNITNMGFMFYNCSLLTSIDLSSFDTSNTTNMFQMFKNCSSLTNIDVSKFNTENVTNMAGMFYNCVSLLDIGMQNFNVKNVEDFSWMFGNCSKLTKLILNDWNAEKLTDIIGIFSGCKSIEKIEMNNFSAPLLTSLSSIFSQMTNVQSISMNSWNIPSITNLSSMFNGLTKLTTLKMSEFNVPSAIDTSNMFQNCSLLTSIDLSSFDTKNVTNMNRMFQYCSNLIDLNISSFDTSNVTDMERMFYECNNLLSLDISGFDTSEVITMYAMFGMCSKLKSLKFGNLNIEKLTNVNNMFLGNLSVKEIDFSLVNSETYEKDIFKSMINQVGNITFYVKDSECKTLMETIKPNATVEIKSA